MVTKYRKVTKYTKDGKEVKVIESYAVYSEEEELEQLHKYDTAWHRTTMRRIKDAYKDLKTSLEWD